MIENEVMLMTVTLEAKTVMMVMKTKTGDASSWKVNKLSQTHQVWNQMEHG